jgi:hypothetical protein
MALAFSGTLPIGHGLEVLEDVLLDHPEDPQMLVVMVDRSKVTAHSTGRVVVTARIREAELLQSGTPGWTAAHELMLWRQAQRTGSTPLPFDE